MKKTKNENKALKTNRKVWKYLVFGFLTFGIYPIVLRTQVGCDFNKIIKGTDTKKTLNFCLIYFLLSPITLTIMLYIWFHDISDKMGLELKKRNIDYKFSSKDFWLWNVLGSFIFVGPAIYLDKFFKASNLLCEDYNKTNNL